MAKTSVRKRGEIAKSLIQGEWASVNRREKGGGEARRGMTKRRSLDEVSCIDARNGPEGERGQKEGAQVRSEAWFRHATAGATVRWWTRREKRNGDRFKDRV